MKLLSKWFSLKYRLRARRWRLRALEAESRVKELQLLLDAERWRNLSREDTFASAAVLGSRNMFGIAPRNGPAVQRQSTPQPAYDPYQLRGVDLLEYEAEWKPHAEAAGISEAQAKREFLAELERRRGSGLQDDPYRAN